MNYILRRCVWEITLACCFSCRYCGSAGGKAREGELNTEECLNVADQLAELGCRRVSMIGGEVFMRPDWDVITERLIGNGVAVNIITNGFMFNDRLLRRLKELNIESVSVSIDAPEKIHDKYRQEGSYRRALNALKVLGEAGIPVSVISTLNSENVDYLEEIYDVLKEYPLFAWQLQACSPMGNAALNGIDYRFDMGRVIEFVDRKLYEAPFSVGVADNIGYFTENEGRIRGNKSGCAVFRGCGAGISAIGIDSTGNVRGCESMYDPVFNEGNLREKTLEEIWNSPDSFKYNRNFSPDMLTGKCAECEMGRYCAGGCRSYNYFVHGKLYEAPFCARK